MPLPRLTRCARSGVPGVTAIVHSPLLSSPVSLAGGAATSQVAWLFADARAATSAFAGLTSERGTACVRNALIGQLRRQRLAVDSSASRNVVLSHTRTYQAISYSLRVSSTVGGPGNAYVNLIQRRHDRAVMSLLWVSIYSPIDPDDLQRLAGRVSHRFVAGVTRATTSR